MQSSLFETESELEFVPSTLPLQKPVLKFSCQIQAEIRNDYFGNRYIGGRGVQSWRYHGVSQPSTDRTRLTYRCKKSMTSIGSKGGDPPLAS